MVTLSVPPGICVCGRCSVVAQQVIRDAFMVVMTDMDGVGFQCWYADVVEAESLAIDLLRHFDVPAVRESSEVHRAERDWFQALYQKNRPLPADLVTIAYASTVSPPLRQQSRLPCRISNAAKAS